MRTCYRIIIGLILLGMLAANAPAWQHAHPQGDETQSHAAAIGTHQHANHRYSAHQHGAHRHEAQQYEPRPQSDSAAVACLHRHVSLFGFELTIPIPAEEQGDESSERILHIAESPTTNAPGTLELSWAVPRDLSSVPLDIRTVTHPRPAFSCKPSQATRLCDAARHERTGVQLI